MPNPSAALLVIGNEVLSAKVTDANGPFIARRLRDLGVRLTAIHVIPDDPEEIAATLVRVRSRCTWVFTTGGVGPTHDDVTLGAVAKALDRPVWRHPGLAAAMRALHRRHHGGEDLPEAALRMADVPEGTRLEGDPEYPTLVVENVVMLPGVPEFCRFQFERFAASLASSPFRLACIYLRVGEGPIAPALDGVVAAHPRVEIGSYPRFDGADYSVKLTVESKDEAHVVAARDALLAALPPGSVIRFEGP
ncbi:MAG: competence/damage-inducible protein A [Anaeromyxobacteraceae bacterium]